MPSRPSLLLPAACSQVCGLCCLRHLDVNPYDHVSPDHCIPEPGALLAQRPAAKSQDPPAAASAADGCGAAAETESNTVIAGAAQDVEMTAAAPAVPEQQQAAAGASGAATAPVPCPVCLGILASMRGTAGSLDGANDSGDEATAPPDGTAVAGGAGGPSGNGTGAPAAPTAPVWPSAAGSNSGGRFQPPKYKKKAGEWKPPVDSIGGVWHELLVCSGAAIARLATKARPDAFSFCV